jgi:hypothetical protein
MKSPVKVPLCDSCRGAWAQAIPETEFFEFSGSMFTPSMTSHTSILSLQRRVLGSFRLDILKPLIERRDGFFVNPGSEAASIQTSNFCSGYIDWRQRHLAAHY